MPGITPAMNRCAIDTFGRHAVDDHDDRRRDQQSQRARAGQRADGDVLGIAAARKLGQGHLADGGAGRRRRARDGGEDRAADDVGVQQPARDALEPRRQALEHVFATAACETGSRPSTRTAAARSASSDDAEPQMVTAMASPAGRDENNSMPIHATPASAMPIHTPLPSSTNSATMSSVVISRSIFCSIYSTCAGSLPARLHHRALRAARRPAGRGRRWRG